MLPFVSVLIPTYNTEHFVSDALHSVLNQTYKNLEIVVVNDGSTDNSLSIVRGIEQQDRRIRVVDLPHRGLAATRNACLAQARGDLILFFDSDDLLRSDAIQVMVDQVQATGAELIAFSSERINEDGSLMPEDPIYQRSPTGSPIPGWKLLRQMVDEGRCVAATQFYIFKTELLKKSGLEFYGQMLHEDEGFSPLLFCFASKAAALSDKLYYYRARANSIINGGISKATSIEGYLDACGILLAYSRIHHLLSHGASEVLRQLVRCRGELAWAIAKEHNCTPYSQAAAAREIRHRTRKMLATHAPLKNLASPLAPYRHPARGIERVQQPDLANAPSDTGLEQSPQAINHRADMDSPSFSLGYVNAEETIRSAAAEGLSVADYLERCWGETGNRYEIARELIERIGPAFPVHRVCEIGAGAGLLTEGIVQQFQPSTYDSYEPDPGWASWLARHFSLTSHMADGKSLTHTPDASAHLVVAHGVFVYLPFLITYSYLMEATRVVAAGGFIAFDILSEPCLDAASASKWLASGHVYPCIFPRDYAIRILAERGCHFHSSFFNRRFGAARSEFLVFRKDPS